MKVVRLDIFDFKVILDHDEFVELDVAAGNDDLSLELALQAALEQGLEYYCTH